MDDKVTHGDMYSIDCPSCDEEIVDVYELLKVPKGEHHHTQLIQCPHCDTIIYTSYEVSYSLTAEISDDTEGYETDAKVCEKIVERIESTLKNHKLRCDISSENHSIYTMYRNEGERCLSTVLIFADERIIITGDYYPGVAGAISCVGYGLDWFANRMDGYYLCEKFTDIEPDTSEHAMLIAIHSKFRQLYAQHMIENSASKDNSYSKGYRGAKPLEEADLHER